MHDIEDYHITPEQAAQIANEAGVKLLVFYHLLPAPDGWLPRRVFAQGISQARHGDWTIADDGSLYTLPIGSTGIQRGRVIDDNAALFVLPACVRVHATHNALQPGPVQRP